MPISRSLRFEVFKRDRFACRYCGQESPDVVLEVDHVMPRSAGGKDEIENLVTACWDCNRGKGARLLSAVPNESNLSEKARLLREREAQLAELTKWREAQRGREDREIAAIWRVFHQAFPNCQSFREQRVRTFLRGLTFIPVLEIMEWTVVHAKAWNGRCQSTSAWHLFCAVCSKKMRERRLETELAIPSEQIR